MKEISVSFCFQKEKKIKFGYPLLYLLCMWLDCIRCTYHPRNYTQVNDTLLKCIAYWYVLYKNMVNVLSRMGLSGRYRPWSDFRTSLMGVCIVCIFTRVFQTHRKPKMFKFGEICGNYYKCPNICSICISSVLRCFVAWIKCCRDRYREHVSLHIGPAACFSACWSMQYFVLFYNIV